MDVQIDVWGSKRHLEGSWGVPETGEYLSRGNLDSTWAARQVRVALLVPLRAHLGGQLGKIWTHDDHLGGSGVQKRPLDTQFWRLGRKVKIELSCRRELSFRGRGEVNMSLIGAPKPLECSRPSNLG